MTATSAPPPKPPALSAVTASVIEVLLRRSLIDIPASGPRRKVIGALRRSVKPALETATKEAVKVLLADWSSVVPASRKRGKEPSHTHRRLLRPAEIRTLLTTFTSISFDESGVLLRLGNHIENALLAKFPPNNVRLCVVSEIGSWERAQSARSRQRQRKSPKPEPTEPGSSPDPSQSDIATASIGEGAPDRPASKN